MEDFEDALRLFMEDAAVEENPWLRPYLERAQGKAKAQAEYMKQVLNGLDFDADGGTKGGGNHGAN